MNTIKFILSIVRELIYFVALFIGIAFGGFVFLEGLKAYNHPESAIDVSFAKFALLFGVMVISIVAIYVRIAIKHMMGGHLSLYGEIRRFTHGSN